MNIDFAVGCRGHYEGQGCGWRGKRSELMQGRTCPVCGGGHVRTEVRLVIIESPYAGNVERNLRYLRSCIRDCVFRGESPYASHRMLTEALDDNDPVEREIGITLGLAWRQAVWIDSSGYFQQTVPVFYEDLGWSSGMLSAAGIYQAELRMYEVRKLPPTDPFFGI